MENFREIGEENDLVDFKFNFFFVIAVKIVKECKYKNIKIEILFSRISCMITGFIYHRRNFCKTNRQI